jgi:hypothetical protein
VRGSVPWGRVPWGLRTGDVSPCRSRDRLFRHLYRQAPNLRRVVLLYHPGPRPLQIPLPQYPQSLRRQYLLLGHQVLPLFFLTENPATHTGRVVILLIIKVFLCFSLNSSTKDLWMHL